MSGAGSQDDSARVAKAAFLRILAQHPELTIDELAELRARHGESFGAITVAEIREIKTRKRDRPRRGPKVSRSPAVNGSKPLRRVLRLLQSSDAWHEATSIAESLGLELHEVEAAVAELVRRDHVQTGFDGQWKYRG